MDRNKFPMRIIPTPRTYQKHVERICYVMESAMNSIRLTKNSKLLFMYDLYAKIIDKTLCKIMIEHINPA